MTTPVSATALLRNPLFWIGVVAILFLFGSDMAMAANNPGGSSSGGLPWEEPLDKLRASITGPVAFIIALLGIIACGATLIWGGEISEFTRRIIYVILVVCIIVFANSILTSVVGAVIPADADVLSGMFPLAEPAGMGGAR